MDTALFDEIYSKVKPLIEKENSPIRDAILSHECLCVTLRVLASGASYKMSTFAYLTDNPNST